MSPDFFPPRPAARPTIYAYEDTNPQYTGLLKVGYTTIDVIAAIMKLNHRQFVDSSRQVIQNEVVDNE